MKYLLELFNVTSEMQFNNLLESLSLSANEMICLEDIMNEYDSISNKRQHILEFLAGTEDGNYEKCLKAFNKKNIQRTLKEEAIQDNSLTMNQVIDFNKFVTLAIKKFKEIDCSSQIYDMISKHTSNKIANAFFNVIKSIPEGSDCNFNFDLEVDGLNVAQTIYPFINELNTFLNSCNKKEINEAYIPSTLINDLLNKSRNTDDIKELNTIKNQLKSLFNYVKDTESSNEIADALSFIDTKLSSNKNSNINETCSAGATCAGAIASIPTPVLTTPKKKKKKRTKVEEQYINLFKSKLSEDLNCSCVIDGTKYTYSNGYIYVNGILTDTKSKNDLLEAIDGNITLNTLPGFSTFELDLLLEDIEASSSVGNEQNTTSIEDNSNNDNDLIPAQRQLKQNNEKTFDNIAQNNSQQKVSLNIEKNNDGSTISDNDKKDYNIIGVDDSDTNNKKYIVQNQNSKQTRTVDATQLSIQN